MKQLLLCLGLMFVCVSTHADEYPSYVRITGHPGDEKVYEALDRVVKVEFPGNSLEDVFEFIGKMHQVPIFMDSKFLEKVGVDPSAEVTWMEEGITLRECLDRNLPEQLGYIVQHGGLTITSATDAATRPDIRMYFVPGDHTEQLDELVHAIEVTFATGTTADMQTSVARFGNFLIVKQTPATHRKIQHLLDAIKKYSGT